MKKGLLITAALAAVLIFALCGCSKQQIDTPTEAPDVSESDEAAQTDENSVTVDGETFSLSYENNHKDLYFKEDREKFQSNAVLTVREISALKDGEVLFSMHIVYFEGKSVEEVMEGSDSVLTDKTVNGLDYKYFEYDENGLPGHTYVYEFNGTTYTISFVSESDISALEDAFMNNIEFKEGE